MQAQPTSEDAPAALIASNLNILDLPAELWVHEIITRLDHHSLKKTEVLCQALKSYIHANHSLRIQLFRERVDKKGLNKLYEEKVQKWEDDNIELDLSKSIKNRDDESLGIQLHPSFCEDRDLTYSIVSQKDDSITTKLKVFAFGARPDDAEYDFDGLKEASDHILQDHPISRETFTQPPVPFFRFDFEKEGKVHRGTSSRYPSTNNSPKAVTVEDVMSTWVKLLGEKKIAPWYDGKTKKKPGRILPVRTSTFAALGEDIKHTLVKIGNTVGIELLDWKLEWDSDDIEPVVKEPEEYDPQAAYEKYGKGKTRKYWDKVWCYSCEERGHKKTQCPYRS